MAHDEWITHLHGAAEAQPAAHIASESGKYQEKCGRGTRRGASGLATAHPALLHIVSAHPARALQH